ncbi:Uncharacterized protein Fot_21868 [Forsythia ovata]|uniref:Uncharacterized protein n=1 Tax=Forsythia ovata TaxID=205694 RepID=A0ABD1UWD3_9LAMI
MLVEEAETAIHDLELTKKKIKTAFQNDDDTIKDMDNFLEQVTWIHGSLSELKTELRAPTNDQDKLKSDMENSKANMAEFLKKYDHTNQVQKVTAKALEEANTKRGRLVDKIAKLDDVVDSLKAEYSGLKAKNLELKRGTKEVVKVGVENFRNQFWYTQDYKNIKTFFVNFHARQVLSEQKELHPTLDLSANEAEYPALEEADEDRATGVKASAQPNVDRA